MLIKNLFYDTNVHKKNPKIVVLPFTGLSQTVADDLRFRFESGILHNLPSIRIIDRNQIESILREHKFNMTMTNIDDSIQLGRLVGWSCQ